MNERKHRGERSVGRRGGVKCRCVALREPKMMRRETFLRRLDACGMDEEME